MLALIIGLTLIVLVAALAMYLGMWGIGAKPGDEPTEHGDGEP